MSRLQPEEKYPEPEPPTFTMRGREYRIELVDRISSADGSRCMAHWDDEEGVLYIDRAVATAYRPALVAELVVRRLSPPNG